MGDGLYEFGLTKILYTWNKYNSVENRTYKWNRFNVVSTKKYCWKKYNVNQGSGQQKVSSIPVTVGDVLWFSDSYNESGGIYTLSGPSNHEVHTTPPMWDQVLYRLDNYPYCIKNAKSGTTMYGPDYSKLPNYMGGWSEYSWEIVNSDTSCQIRLQDEGYLRPEDGMTATQDIIEYGPSQTKGSLIGNVYSTSSSAYPTDGISGSYWYERYSAGDTTEYSKGTANGSVTSSNSSAYPSNGKSGNYWYVSNGYTSSWSKGTLIGPVTSTQIDAYPDDGRHTDGFWYVKQT